MNEHGFLRVVAGSPQLRLADCQFNAERTLDILREVEDLGADLAVFPECGLTGYTCHDLFHDTTLLNAAESALEMLLGAAGMCFGGVGVVGLPVMVAGRLFNCAAVFRGSRLLGVVPKSFLPTYKEFYDARYFAPASASVMDTVTLAGQTVPFGTDLLFVEADHPECVIGVEICEDLWTPLPPSGFQALAGATVLVNLSASNEVIGKAAYRKQLVAEQSGRCIAAYVYAAAGIGESTTDIVFGGHNLIAENGLILQESKRFQRDGHHIVADVDVRRLTHERGVTNSFHGSGHDVIRNTTFRRVSFTLNTERNRRPTLLRYIDPHPFVPSDARVLQERCEEIFLTQTTALGRRLEHIGWPKVTIGVSGGLDSTLALLVLAKTYQAYGQDPKAIHAYTMPGFGTTTRTKSNADVLMDSLGVTSHTIDIREMTFQHLKALNHAPFGIDLKGLHVDELGLKLQNLPRDRRSDLVFENTQARLRTMILMNAGFVIGTGDLSELALGWCTYNADHMSMYNPNISIPKTLVKFLVGWAAESQFDGLVRETLRDVVATEISPELLPLQADGSPGQSTEGTIGPYELHDFFLYHFVRHGETPPKILFLASQAKFRVDYSAEVIRKWLGVFLKRFFASQFKRSCLPDGPKVGSVSLSPRGDWRMPSDTVATAWLKTLD